MSSLDESCCAVVAGATGGIGRAVALGLASRGLSLCLVARNTAKLASLVSECKEKGARAISASVDLSDPSSVSSIQETLEKCKEEFGRVNILINTVGVPGSFDGSLEDWEMVMQVNTLALMRVTKLALPYIQERGSGVGAIINIGSVAGKLIFKSSPFCASKHAVVGFSGSLFENLREQGIKVSCLNPGYIATDLVAPDEKLDRSRMIQPEDILYAVLFVLQAPDTMCPTEIYLRPQRTPYR